MAALFEPERHCQLDIVWSEADAQTAIEEIADDALANFDSDTFWPAHPLDGVPSGLAGLYMGASGVILALNQLRRAGAIKSSHDFTSTLPKLIERDDFGMGATSLGQYGSLLMRDVGPLLLFMRLFPNTPVADRIYERLESNNDRPVLELMWGTAGSMLACIFAHSMTGERRFVHLYQKQAARLLSELETGGRYRIWTQDLYGQRARYVGLVHGFSGNVFALIRGWKWLGEAQRRLVQQTAVQTLSTLALRENGFANWATNADQPDAPPLVQICHGAPGIVAAFADAPFAAPEFDQLLNAAGELIWRAGPLQKGSNFCHGTGGNAYALLKLCRRTEDARWLERARTLASAAIAQYREARTAFGRDRYSLWTGDAGLAIILWNCITNTAGFPSVDSF